jgi:hypothetical protein
MSERPACSPAVRLGILFAFFVSTLTLRVWGISKWFWLLGDQIRDWGIALGPFSDLPLVGPATHVSGYTVGPAFYWILWIIRVAFGPWYHNLPHAGGIGQAALGSAADVLLLLAVWRRTQSVWVALAVAVLVTTAPYDLALAPLIWNPVVGSTLAKLALASVLVGWYRASGMRAAITAALAWAAVHAYTGTIFVAVSVFVALILEPLLSKDWRAAGRRVLVVVAVVLTLQIPYAVHQVRSQFSDSAMGAVTDSVTQILTGQASPELSTSLNGFVQAVDYIQGKPWHVPLLPWVLLAVGITVGVAFRRDPVLLCVLLLPQVLAVAGYAFFLAGLDNYYYLSLMPSVVLTFVLALTLPGLVRWTTPVAVVLFVVALAIVPARMKLGATFHRMPEYGAIVAASRTMAERGQPLRGIETSFPLPPTSDAEFVYRILGGSIDPASNWIGIIDAGGGVRYRQVDGL